MRSAIGRLCQRNPLRTMCSADVRVRVMMIVVLGAGGASGSCAMAKVRMLDQGLATPQAEGLRGFYLFWFESLPRFGC